jgi:glutaminase
MSQLTLDLSKPRTILQDSGKKTERVTFTASDDLSEMLKRLSSKLNLSVSEYCQQCVIECASRDIGKILLIQAKADKPLKDLL